FPASRLRPLDREQGCQGENRVRTVACPERFGGEASGDTQRVAEESSPCPYTRQRGRSRSDRALAETQVSDSRDLFGGDRATRETSSGRDTFTHDARCQT